MNGIRSISGMSALTQQQPTSSGPRGPSGLDGRCVSVAKAASASFSALTTAYGGPRPADVPRSLGARALSVAARQAIE